MRPVAFGLRLLLLGLIALSLVVALAAGFVACGTWALVRALGRL